MTTGSAHTCGLSRAVMSQWSHAYMHIATVVFFFIYSSNFTYSFAFVLAEGINCLAKLLLSSLEGWSVPGALGAMLLAREHQESSYAL